MQSKAKTVDQYLADLPAERREIFRVHLAKRKMDADKFDFDALSRASEGYSGAEIEEAIISAMFDAFYEKQELTTDRLRESLQQTVPLSKTMKEDIDELRKWAASRARPATSPEAAQEGEGGRKLEI